MNVTLAIFGLIAVACLVGWAATLFAMTRGILWMVNAMAVAERTQKRMDEQIREVVASIAKTRPQTAEAVGKRARAAGFDVPETPNPFAARSTEGTIFDQPEAVEG